MLVNGGSFRNAMLSFRKLLHVDGFLIAASLAPLVWFIVAYTESMHSAQNVLFAQNGIADWHRSK
jgi:hypothetical protein